jgi:hypothetical protein
LTLYHIQAPATEPWIKTKCFFWLLTSPILLMFWFDTDICYCSVEYIGREDDAEKLETSSPSGLFFIKHHLGHDVFVD